MATRHKSFADDGWAVWIDGDDTSTIYLNDWLNPKKHSYVDIAVHTRGIRGTNSLNVYMPFPVTKEELTDISLLLKDRSILCAKFNAACIIDYMKNDCTSEIAYHGKTVDLVHVSKLKYSLEPMGDGTFFHMGFGQLHEFLDNNEAYFLFRIPHKSLDSIFATKLDVGRFAKRMKRLITTPVKQENYGYSVRINEVRLLPTEINRTGAFHRQKLKRVAVSISVNEEYEVNDQGCYRIRRLEDKLYSGYVPQGFSCEDVITYQWDQNREKNLHGHFNFYFSIARNSVSRVSMLIYMLMLVIFGSMGSALYDLIKLLID